MGVTIIPKGMEGDDHYFVPRPDGETGETRYVGKLDPNFFCRGWNAKRKKYCMARAGQATDHPGEGRCRNHGGTSLILHGRFSEVTRGSIREHHEKLEIETEAEKLDILPEATMARALVANYVEEYEKFRDQIMEYNADEAAEAEGDGRKPRFLKVPDLETAVELLERCAKIVDMVHKQRSANAVSLPDFFRVMALMSEVVNLEVRKLEQKGAKPQAIEECLQKIAEDWATLKLKKL